MHREDLPSHTTTPRPDIGSDHILESNLYRAAIDEIGATVRELTHDGRALVVPYPAGTVRPLYRGATCAPWPNRIADGRYTFDGVQHQLALNEPDRGHALHGLVQWIRWTPTEVTPDSVTLEHDLVPQDGYPFALHLVMTYRLGPDGLAATMMASNTGSAATPYGYCPHPYLVPGPGIVDDWYLDLEADQRLQVDGRLVPVGLSSVDAVDADFRGARGIGDRRIDHAFTGLQRDDTGNAVVALRTSDGNGVHLAFGAWATWVQVHTADRPEPEWNRIGLAVEPMSCPPDAFNSGTDLVVLQPGDSHIADWRISAITPIHPGNRAIR